MVEPQFDDKDRSTPEARRVLHEENRLSWNAATKAHNSHKADQAKFLREGGNKLFPEETELLGDLRGKSVLHLQCNAGQDTLCIKRLGAAKVTGVDISDEAIEFARKLSADSGLEAEFHRADVYDWLAEAAGRPERYDIVFCSYGAVCWLSDLCSWAMGFAALLKPGGRFVTVEFHPVAWMFDEEYRHKYPYASGGQMMTWPDGVSDYVGASGPDLAPSGWMEGVKDFQNPYPVHEFGWGIGDILMALIEAGLVIEHVKEYPYANGDKMFSEMRRLPGRRVTQPEGVPGFPLMYSIAARKPG